jgi:peptidoglycan/xylan/chitin deacetylase (PgdA/CDA1 family)
LRTQAPAATHYVVFDACRNELNLTRKGAKALTEKGFVPIAYTPGVMVAYATAPGRTAADGGGGGGPYARALADELVKPGIEAMTMFRRVALRVNREIGQDPWMSASTLPEVYFAGQPSAAAPAAAAKMSEAAEAWDRVKDTSNTALLEAFVTRYKETFYADLARARVEELRKQLASVPAPAPPPTIPSRTLDCLGATGALGVARKVEIDTTGGPGFGLEQYKAHDFLRPKEVVLTFDDGPWPGNTRAVLEALANHCTKAIFFPIGKHALWHPEILKQVAAAGHTIGGHTWSHANLAVSTMDFEKATAEVEKGFSAVKLALGADPAPFFRFPYLKDPKSIVDYLGTRNIAIFSFDLDSFDFKMHKPEDVLTSVMTKLERKGKGIILMHDFQTATAKAIPIILDELKAKDYKVVQMVPKNAARTIAKYDTSVANEVTQKQ